MINFQSTLNDLNLSPQEKILFKDIIAFAKSSDSEEEILKKFYIKKQKLAGGIPLDYLLEEFKLANGLKMKVRPGVFIPREETEEWLEKFQNVLQKKYSRTSSLSNLSFPKPSSKRAKLHKASLLSKGFRECCEKIPIYFETYLNVLNSKNSEDLVAIDYGSGSGIISLTLQKSSLFQKILSCDINPKALETTKNNFLKNNLKPPILIQTKALKNFKIINHIKNNQEWIFVCNPPYVPEKDLQEAKRWKVEKEPAEAIYSGVDGLDLFRQIILDLKQIIYKEQQFSDLSIKKPLAILFELDPRNIQTAKKFMKANLSKNYRLEIWKDFRGFERVLVGFLS